VLLASGRGGVIADGYVPFDHISPAALLPPVECRFPEAIFSHVDSLDWLKWFPLVQVMLSSGQGVVVAAGAVPFEITVSVKASPCL